MITLYQIETSVAWLADECQKAVALKPVDRKQCAHLLARLQFEKRQLEKLLEGVNQP